jgi:hypothetical protein
VDRKPQHLPKNLKNNQVFSPMFSTKNIIYASNRITKLDPCLGDKLEKRPVEEAAKTLMTLESTVKANNNGAKGHPSLNLLLG